MDNENWGTTEKIQRELCRSMKKIGIKCHSWRILKWLGSRALESDRSELKKIFTVLWSEDHSRNPARPVCATCLLRSAWTIDWYLSILTKVNHEVDREMVQWLGVFGAPAKDPGLLSRTHRATHNLLQPQFWVIWCPLLASVSTNKHAHGSQTYKLAKHP